MGDQQKLEDAAEGFADAISDILDDKSEDGLAKASVALLSLLTGSPWLGIVTPILARVLRRLNGEARHAAMVAIGRDADAVLADQRLSQLVGGSVERALTLVLQHAEAAAYSAGADTLASVGVQLRRLEDSIVRQLRPGPWLAMSPGTRELRPDAKPSDLLVAANQAVAFIGRQPTLAALTAWVHSSEPVALTLITGPGGAGKTRLAIEACKAWRSEGIAAGFLVSDVMLGDALSGDLPRVIVIDYAEGRLALLEDLLKRISGMSNPRVRVLMIARSRGEWWSNLARVPGTDSSVVYRALHVFLDSDQAQLSSEDRAEIWHEGCALFARHTQHIALSAPLPSPKLDSMRRPLTLLMHAMIAVGGEVADNESELLARVLDHERRHLRSIVESLGLTRVDQRSAMLVAERMLALVTLAGADVRESSLRAFARDQMSLQLGRSDEGLLDAILKGLAELYPGGESVGPLEPDLLGEELVAQVTSNSNHAKVLFESGMQRTSSNERKNFLRVLGRLARRTGDLSRLQTLFANCVNLASRAALVVIPETGGPKDPISIALRDEIARNGYEHPDLCKEISLRCPTQSFALSEVALAATRVCLETARASVPGRPTDSHVRVAMLANDLSNRLRDLGLTKEARELSEETVRIFKAFTSRDRKTFLPHLALALHTHSSHTAAGGDFGALGLIRQAVELYEELASTSSAFRPGLAKALMSLANRLSEAGDHRAALTVAERCERMFRRLAIEDSQYESHFAKALDCLGKRQAACSQEIAALISSENAAKRCRLLVERAPDAFLPDFALILFNLSIRQSALRRHKEAVASLLEGVAIYFVLARSVPERYLREFHGACWELGSELREVGRDADSDAIRTALKEFDDRGNFEALGEVIERIRAREGPVSERDGFWPRLTIYSIVLRREFWSDLPAFMSTDGESDPEENR